MKLLGIDFETQSAEPKTTNATEVGAVLYELSHGALHKLEEVSELLFMPTYPPQSEKIIELTGITDGMLVKDGKKPSFVFEQMLFPLMEKADYIFAHKKSFDQTVLESTAARYNQTPPQKPWVCTLTEWPWPKKFTCHKLSHLAYEHGIMVDPRTLHRASQDVELMMRLIGTYDIESCIEYAKQPWVYLRGEPKAPWTDGGVQTGVAKSLGFGWEQVKGTDGPRFPKAWVTRVKQSELASLVKSIHESEAPFKFNLVEGLS